jgi:hypothetical protein
LNTNVNAQVRKKNWEWFQWLAEQIDRHSKARTSLTLGAHEAHRDWRP